MIMICNSNNIFEMNGNQIWKIVKWEMWIDNVNRIISEYIAWATSLEYDTVLEIIFRCNEYFGIYYEKKKST